MGEIAEAMLNGVFCQQCGTFLGDEVGYPRTCHGCRAPEGPRPEVKRVPYRCPICGKKAKWWRGVLTHLEQSHAKSKKISRGRLAAAVAYVEGMIAEGACDDE